MALIEIRKDPSRRELAVFGALFALFLGIVGAIVWHKAHAPRVAIAIWSVAAVVTLAYYLVPPMRRGLYLGWMYAAFPIGFVVSHVLLGIVYYGVFTPVGRIMRLVGHDPMQRRLDPDAETYWIERRAANDVDRYFRQF